MSKKVRIFTHSDLDGVGSAVILAVKYGLENVMITFCGYDNIDFEVVSFISSDIYKGFSDVFVTDISVSPDVADMLDKLNSSGRVKVHLLDHHKTAVDLNKYSWASVKVERPDGRLATGASLVWEYVFPDDAYSTVARFAEMVRQYDSWEWYKEKIVAPGHLNDLLALSDFYGFVEMMYSRLTDADDRGERIFDPEDSILIKTYNRLKEGYVKKKLDEVRILGNDQLGRYAVVFADQYVNDVASAITDQYTDINFVAVITIAHNLISLRTATAGVDVSKIAVKNGGGGHVQAAGFYVSDKVKSAYLRNALFGNG